MSSRSSTTTNQSISTLPKIPRLLTPLMPTPSALDRDELLRLSNSRRFLFIGDHAMRTVGLDFARMLETGHKLSGGEARANHPN
ncbi:unnamed protein product, partial [Rotaria sp. Silwood1]